MSKKLTLITPTQGNPIALKRTVDSLKEVINEVVVGDVCIFEEDREKIKTCAEEADLKLITLPFNFIFKNGFAATLNTLAQYATNDTVLYMNVGEILISDKHELKDRLSPSYNCYYLIHPTEKHHWYRCYNRKEIQWTGIIHEEIIGNFKGCSVPLLMFDDTPKDDEGSFYNIIMNDIKELVYWNNYVKLIDQPHLVQNTNQGWVKFSHDGFHGFIERLHAKGDMYEAMIRGDYELLMKAIENKKENK